MAQPLNPTEVVSLDGAVKMEISDHYLIWAEFWTERDTD
jgi:hypothetical protein